MGRTGKIALALATVLLLAATAGAQNHMRPASATVIGPPGTRVIRVAASQLANGNVPVNATALRTSDGATVESLLTGYPAPGLGFDFTHHSAVNRNLATRALIDPITQHRLDQARRIRREAPALGAVIPAVINNLQIVVVQSPPIVILPVADEADEEADARRRSRRARERAREEEAEEDATRARAAEAPRAAASAERAPAAPPREVGDMVLIKRDGGLVFAVAYVVRGERVVYVTREGQRQSIALSHLDFEATRDMNESLGTTVKLQ